MINTGAIPTTTKPGVLRGAIMCLKIWTLEAPSTNAASSKSIGIYSKYDFNNHIAVGIKKATPGTIIAWYVLRRPKVLKTLYKGIKSTAPENIFIASKIYKDEFLKGNLKRA